mgnify:CR=1 FL=1
MQEGNESWSNPVEIRLDPLQAVLEHDLVCRHLCKQSVVPYPSEDDQDHDRHKDTHEREPIPHAQGHYFG